MILFLFQENPEDVQVLRLLFEGGIAGSIVMFSLIIMFVVSIYFIIERLLFIRKNYRFNPTFFYKLNGLMEEGNMNEAIDTCKAQNTPHGRIFHRGLRRLEKGSDEYKKSIEDAAQTEIYYAEKNLNALATIAGAGPMLGFLGTVIGMIIAFHDMASASDGTVNVKMLSEGIYTAMMTTVVGLIVGIVAYLAYNYFVNEVEKIGAELENGAIKLLQTYEDQQ